MESYVERWKREQAVNGEKLKLSSLYGEMHPERKPVKKSGSRRKQREETQVREETRRKEETQDGTDSRSEGHEAPKTQGGRE